jgi:hypothetical protein
MGETVQASVSVRVAPVVHVPAEQSEGRQLRLRVPAVLQDVASVRVQGPKGSQVGGPQVVPSVVRVHASVSVVLARPQAPAAHAKRVVVRVRVPAVAHTSPEPMHALHAEVSSVPHDIPSVARPHPDLSVSSTLVGAQAPPLHVKLVTVRERVPSVEQVSSA